MTAYRPMRSIALAALLLAGCASGSAPSSSLAPPSEGAATTATDASAPTSADPSAAAGTASLAPGAFLVPGTHVALVPPDGFTTATGYPGFQHVASGSSIVITELPGPYDQVVAGFTQEAFAAQGVEVHGRTEVTLEGRPALLIEARQQAQGITFGKWILATGTDELTALLNSNYPESETTIGESLRAALLAASFDPARPSDPAAALSFTITPSPPLVFGGAFSNGAVYNTSGTIPSADPLEPTLAVAPSLGAAPVGDAEAFARQRLEQTPLIKDIAIEATSPVTVAGLDGVEIVAAAKHEVGNDALVVYQVLLVTEEGYVLLSGQCRLAERDVCLGAFRSTTETYRQKPAS